LDARLEKVHVRDGTTADRKSGDIDLLEKLRVPEKKQVFKVWQDRFDDVYLVNKKLLETKLDYIHMNPLREHWNLVSAPIGLIQVPCFTNSANSLL